MFGFKFDSKSQVEDDVVLEQFLVIVTKEEQSLVGWEYSPELFKLLEDLPCDFLVLFVVHLWGYALLHSLESLDIDEELDHPHRANHRSVDILVAEDGLENLVLSHHITQVLRELFKHSQLLLSAKQSEGLSEFKLVRVENLDHIVQ